jgi:hypothetical protein
MADANLQDLQNFFKQRNQGVREERDEMAQIIGSFLEAIDKSKLSEKNRPNKNNK